MQEIRGATFFIPDVQYTYGLHTYRRTDKVKSHLEMLISIQNHYHHIQRNDKPAMAKSC